MVVVAVMGYFSRPWVRMGKCGGIFIFGSYLILRDSDWLSCWARVYIIALRHLSSTVGPRHNVIWMAVVLEVCIKYINKSTACLVPKASDIINYMAFVHEVCIKYINKSTSCLVPKASDIINNGWRLYLRGAANT